MGAWWLAGVGAVGAAAAAHQTWRATLGTPRADLPPVLAYHKIGTPELGGTWCGGRQFAAQLDALQRAGFTALDAGAFAARVARLESGISGASGVSAAATNRGREVFITFDDAFESFATHAWPELQRRGLPALLFVISDYVGRKSTWDLPLPGHRVAHLDWAALRALAREGVAIGSHGATHLDLRRLDDGALVRELRGSRQRLEDGLGVAVRSVSYPFGRQDARVRAAAVAAGYRLGFSMCPPGPNRIANRMALRRWGVYVIDPPSAVLDKVDAQRPGFWIQDLTVRAINACASVAAARR